MEALRKVVIGEDLPNSFNIPESLKKRKLEVIIIPLEEDVPIKKELKKLGSLNAYANLKLIDDEKTAWEKAVREKHENSRC